MRTFFGGLAQLGERNTGSVEVSGSQNGRIAILHSGAARIGRGPWMARVHPAWRGFFQCRAAIEVPNASVKGFSEFAPALLKALFIHGLA